MRRLSLSAWLTAFTLATVLVATAAVGSAGVSLLRLLAEEHALTRVRLAANGAHQAIEREGRRLLVSARVLAERPTLARLLGAGDVRSLAGFLADFGETSGLAGCALADGGRIRVSSGELPWDELEARHPAGGGWFLLTLPGYPPVLAAGVDVPGFAGTEALAARLLDDAYARETADKVGLELAILTEWPGDLPAPLRAAEAVEAAAARVDGRFVAVLPLRDPRGTAAGRLEVSLPVSAALASVDELVRTLLLLTGGVAIAMTLVALALSRRLARPVAVLTGAAARIGLGDFSSPVPRVAGRETGKLAATMEEMRGRVLHLTTELEQRKAQAEATLSGIAEGVFAVDRERRLRYLNPQAAELLGLREDDALGRFCGDVLRPRASGGARPCDAACPILHARFRGRARATEHLLLKSGERRSVVISSAAAETPPDGTGKALQYQVVRDETAVEATRRLRDAVLANISHEFRSPLSAQLASIELLRDQLSGDPPSEIGRDEIRPLVLSLERGTLRLTRLIDNLLESIRIEAGESTLRRRGVALDQVVEEAVGLMAPLIEQRGQKLEVELPYPLPEILGDGPRLAQVFVNLLANANKFAPAETTIRVAGEVGERHVTLWVADEGPGLPEGAEGALFERFIRSPDAEPEQGGMGLGLWIVKSIVDRHGGRVETDSSSAGTRIRVILPIRSQDEDPGG